MTSAMKSLLSQVQADTANAAKPAPKVKGKKAKVKEVKQAVKKGGTIAASIIAGLRAGRTPQKVLEAVQKKHKDCKTTIACVYWYSSRIKRGLIPE